MNDTGPNALLVAQLRAWAPKHGHMCIEHGEATELRVQREGIHIKLTVPHGVSEWFVDVCDATDKVVLHDWLDYAGYDDTPADALARDMREEVMRFVDTIGTHPLRLVPAGTQAGTQANAQADIQTNTPMATQAGTPPAALQLQWQDAQQWRTCLPFSAASPA